eukprot:scaffold106518_cov18-Tisochrysis_lutea.AAC.1
MLWLPCLAVAQPSALAELATEAPCRSPNSPSPLAASTKQTGLKQRARTHTTHTPLPVCGLLKASAHRPPHSHRFDMGHPHPRAPAEVTWLRCWHTDSMAPKLAL